LSTPEFYLIGKETSPGRRWASPLPKKCLEAGKNTKKEDVNHSKRKLEITEYKKPRAKSA